MLKVKLQTIVQLHISIDSNRRVSVFVDSKWRTQSSTDAMSLQRSVYFNIRRFVIRSTDM